MRQGGSYKVGIQSTAKWYRGCCSLPILFPFTRRAYTYLMTTLHCDTHQTRSFNNSFLCDHHPSTSFVMASLHALFLQTLLGSAALATSCYYPDGSVAQDNYSCSNEYNTTCCAAGYACLSGGICASSPFNDDSTSNYYRGTCTDETYTSPCCPNYCLNATSNSRSDDTGMWKCNDQGDNVFVCDGGPPETSNCLDHHQLLRFPGSGTKTC